jgi:hypothetical protein
MRVGACMLVFLSRALMFVCEDDDKDDDKDTRFILSVDTRRTWTESMFYVGARLMHPPPGSDSNPLAATVSLRKSDESGMSYVFLVWDNLALSGEGQQRQFNRVNLTEDFLRTFRGFISDDDDVPKETRVVTAYMARCQTAAEGFLYGDPNGGVPVNNFVSPAFYEPVPCKTKELRHPDQLKEGMYIQCHGRTDTYVLVQFLHAVAEQVRYFALLGDEQALKASSSLRPRYYVVPMTCKRESTFAHVDNTTECPDAVLRRLKSDAPEYIASISAAQLRRGECGLPVMPLPLTHRTYGNALLRPVQAIQELTPFGSAKYQAASLPHQQMAQQVPPTTLLIPHPNP